MSTKSQLALICLLAIGGAGTAVAQFPNIRVSQTSSIDPEEVVIAINPANPANIVVGANVDYYFTSQDGGMTWSQGRLTSSLGVFGDPCVAFDTHGNLYYSHLSNPPAPGRWLDRIVVQKSVDGGTSWDDGVGIGHNAPKQQDKEWLAIDLTDSPYRDNLYLAWTEFDSLESYLPSDSTRIVMSRSTDQGSNWSTPVRVSDLAGSARDDDTSAEGTVPAIGPEGQIYMSWALDEMIYFDKSTDGGATFGRDVAVTRQPGGWIFGVPGLYRCNGWPVTACDVSQSPYRGNIYISWTDQRNGTDNTDVFIIKSTDGGQSWHSRVKVNNDLGAAHQFFQWMTVDPVTGFIYVVFYDRRETTGIATDVYLAVSRNGGADFENFRVSESSFTPDDEVFFGDYIGVAARDGMVYPAWSRFDGSDLSIWIAIINDTQPEVVSPRFEVRQNYPNPFRASTTIAFRLQQSTQADLSIYDLRGALVRSLLSGNFIAQDHEMVWDGTDNSGNPASDGIYFVRLTTPHRTVTRKMTLTR